MLDKVLTKISRVSNIKVLYRAFYSFLFFTKHRSSFVFILPFIEILGNVCHFTRINDRKIVFCCSRSSLDCFPSFSWQCCQEDVERLFILLIFASNCFSKLNLVNVFLQKPLTNLEFKFSLKDCL